MQIHPLVDFVGIGAGPANLSLAALSAPIRPLRTHFFERTQLTAWHPGLLFPESLLQTSFLKDLVTPVDPTSVYSFLAYLVHHKRFYPFVTAAFPQISRAEFGEYLAWVARSLPNLELGTAVEEVTVDDDAWMIRTTRGTTLARDLVLGTGRQPNVPQCAKAHLGPAVFHSEHYCLHNPELKGKRIAIIGGGQSGAEILQHVLLDSNTLPERVVWVSRRSNFLPLDDSPFANEWFTPEYSEFFYGLEHGDKVRAVAEQTLASDGVSLGLLEEIYRRLYQLRFIERRDPRGFTLLPGHDLTRIDRTPSGFRLQLESSLGATGAEEFDTVVLCTGYRWHLPSFMESLQGRIDLVDGEPMANADFSLRWDGPTNRRIFAQNAARTQRGVADPNLSLLAWRSAVILNNLIGRPVYDIAPASAIIDWDPQPGEFHHGDYTGTRVAL